ncbi:MAG TPA: class I SAM-dependent methyltransferase [Stellaceae bacterium]|nr:class I SAM-dependent methyltransferase [Stellaceae bacterium]
MADTDKLFAGSIPTLYDRYLGPFLFEPYALDMAERLARHGARRILETAAGTGIVTRTIAVRLPDAALTATDLNQPMLDHAMARAGTTRVSWQQADAQALPFEDERFDAVACQFGAMFFPDKVKGYAEARRVLRPGGAFVFSVWDRIEENEVTDTVTRAVAQAFPGDPPNFMARTPHGYHDLGLIGRALREAGFERIESETVTKRGRAPSPRDPATGICQGTPLRNEIEARDKTRLAAVTDAAAAAVAARLGDGAIDSKIQAHVITAWR